MTRAQSMDVLNDTTTMQSRIDTVLATPQLDYTNDSGWHPGDPLYARPMKGLPGHQWTRPMIELHEHDQGHDLIMVPAESHDGWSTEYFTPRCGPCEVSWSDGDTCWNCGAECPRPSYGHFGGWPSAAVFDETHEWAQADLRPMVDAVNQMSAAMADFSAVERRAITWLGTDTGRMWFLPEVENPSAPTLDEIRQGEPLAEWEREFLAELTAPEEPVIHFPEGAVITPVAEIPLPPEVTLTGRRRRPVSPRFYFDRPVTERRRS